MKLKKILASVLALAMLLSMTCFAEDAAATPKSPVTVTEGRWGNTVIVNDDFSSYNATNSAYTADNAVTSGLYSFHSYWPGYTYYDGLFNSTRVHSPVGNPATVAQTSYGHYETSVAYNGAWFHGNRKPGSAYIGDDGALYVKDNYSYGTAVNYDVEGAKVTDVVRVKARTRKPGGIRILVSGDEKSFYEIGRPKGDNSSVMSSSNQPLAVTTKTTAEGGTETSTTANVRAPYFSKIKDGQAVVLDKASVSTTSSTDTNINAPVFNDAGTMYIDNSEWDNIWADFWVDIELSIDLGTSTVNWSVTQEKDGHTWTGSFYDEELFDMMDATVYPFAFFSAQEQTAIFDDVEAEFTTEAKPTYYTDFDGITRGENAAYTMQEAESSGGYGTYKANSGDTPYGTEGETYIYAQAEPGVPKTIVTSNGADLVLSGIRTRYYNNTADGKPNTGKAIYNETTDAIMLTGRAGGQTSINLKPHNADYGYDSISNVGVKFTYNVAGDTSRMIDFLVNKKEDTYYSFGYGRDKVPFASKTVNGSNAALTVYDYTTGAEIAPVAVNDLQVRTVQYLYVSIDEETNTVYLTCKHDADDVFTWYFEDADLASMIANTAYPMSVSANGDGVFGFSKVFATYEATEAPDLYEDFSSYDETNAAYTGAYNGQNINSTSEDAQTYYSFPTAKPWEMIEIADNGKTAWYSSPTMGGAATYNPETANGAYSGRLGVDLDRDSFVVDDTWNWATAAYMMPEKAFLKTDKIKVAFAQHADTTVSVRFMVSEDENTYYEIGRGRNGANYIETSETNVTTKEDGTDISKAIRQYTPFFQKVVNGEVVGFMLPPAKWTYVADAYGSQSMEVSFSDAGVDFTISAGSQSWSGTYADTGVAAMESTSSYLLGGYARGDGSLVIDDISVWGTFPKDLVINNNDGTSLVNIQPAMYPDAASLTVIAAYYDGTTDELLSVEVIPVTNMAEDTDYTVTHNKAAGSYGKLFVWKGDIADVYPLASADLY